MFDWMTHEVITALMFGVVIVTFIMVSVRD